MLKGIHPMNDYQYGKTGLTLTESFEGLKLTAYRDVCGVWTIGYGHTGPDVHPGMTITQAEAEELLLADVAHAVATVNRCVTVKLNQDQFDALVDFAFNAGCGALEGSTLLKDLNAGDYAAAADQFEEWDHAGDKVVAGLLRRREAEATLFGSR
jgi:lysozyme